MRDKKVVVLAGGCFDVLHPGHLEFLKRSKKLGDQLIILLESDLNVKKLKGQNRPLNSQKIRADNLMSTGLVDSVISLDSKVSDKYYLTIVKSVNPDIIAVTKGDPITIKKRLQAKEINAKLIEVMDRNKNFSTTKIVDEIKI